MSKKRVSLSEIEKEDFDTQHDVMPAHSHVMKEESRIQKSEKIFHKTEIGNIKSDMTKMSIMVPTHMFERLQDISRERRRSKQPFKLTELAREALHDWLPKQAL